MVRRLLSKRRIGRRGVLWLVCFLVSVGHVAAQGSGGVIAGTIKDAQGGAASGRDPDAAQRRKRRDAHRRQRGRRHVSAARACCPGATT